MVRPEVPSYGLLHDMTNSEQDTAAYYYLRWVYDLVYFVVIMLVLRNIIFGIILQSFAQLRDTQQKKGEEMANKCFICSIERSLFDRAAAGFENHIKNDHNMWQYLYFIVRLRLRDTSLYTGVENYVHAKLEKADIGWFPLHRAMALDVDREDPH